MQCALLKRRPGAGSSLIKARGDPLHLGGQGLDLCFKREHADGEFARPPGRRKTAPLDATRDATRYVPLAARGRKPGLRRNAAAIPHECLQRTDDCLQIEDALLKPQDPLIERAAWCGGLGRRNLLRGLLLLRPYHWRADDQPAGKSPTSKGHDGPNG
jgi:hypothetical protein